MEENIENSENSIIKTEDPKKKYCDKQFKVQLAKALKINSGEAGNFDQIKGNKLLCQYDPEKIIEYTNSLANDIQNNVESRITDPKIKQFSELAKNVDFYANDCKSQEIPMLLKLNSVTKGLQKNKVNFEALNKYLYSAVSGSLDYVDMNYETRLVLQDTYKIFMEEVERDAPNVLEELQTRIITKTEAENKKLVCELLEDPNMNPFNIPVDLLFQKKSS